MTIVTSSAIVRPLMPVRADSDPANARPGTATGVAGAGTMRMGARGDRAQIGGELIDVDLGLDLHLGRRLVDRVGRATERDAREALDGLAPFDDVDAVGRRAVVAGVVGRRLGRDRHRHVGVRLDGGELERRPEGAVAGSERQLARLLRRLGVGDAHDVGHASRRC